MIEARQPFARDCGTAMEISDVSYLLPENLAITDIDNVSREYRLIMGVIDRMERVDYRPNLDDVRGLVRQLNDSVRVDRNAIIYMATKEQNND